ncbi:uncharacterized protein LODBEIA_P29400 [Lodderomyces beijingensis]|uniref:N-terminal acetyltransferase B complex subunit MDM20 n=1 Tax=Lodderomyces beijingensis TaxID=1775926 RepID=A0ABP0ZP90_9ASCO
MPSESDNEIIEYIDRGHYHYAQTLLQQKSKRFPQRPLYPILQNKILAKTGHQKAAVEKNLSILQSCPNDIDSIVQLSNFFSELEMEKEANACFENAIKRFPTKAGDLGMIWFENCVETLDVNKLNRIFSHLNKSNKQEAKYCYWYAFSFYLMVAQNTADDESKSKLFRMFGKKLIEGIQEAHPFANCSELYVYTRFLLLEKDYQAIQSILSEVKFPLDLELQILYLESMRENESWHKLYSHATKLLLDDKFDDYDTWILWINAGKNVGKDYAELRSKLGGGGDGGGRNESLVKIELALLFDKDPTSEIGEYYDNFNGKMCCYNDLSKYNLSKQMKEQIRSRTKSILASDSKDSKQVITLVNNQRLHPTVDNWEIFNAYTDFSSSKSEFDNNPLNELTLVSIITDLSKTDSSKGNSDYYQTIIKNIAIITELLKSDKYNYKLNLWAIKLYSQLNTNNAILPIYKAMKIRMVQHETLGYLLNNAPTSDKSTFNELTNVYRFYLTSAQEMNDTVLTGFDEGVYNKLGSFISFGQRLQNSISLNTNVQQNLQAALIQNDTQFADHFIHHIQKNRKKIVLEEYTDNRDFTSDWNAINISNELQKAKDDQLLRIPVDDVSIKMHLLVYLLINENDEGETLKLLKAFNKITSSGYRPDPFTSLLWKLYYNIIKIACTKINANETQSLFNFVQKNLKFDKLDPLVVPENVLSYQLNRNLLNFAEFIKVVAALAKRKPSSYLNQVLKLANSAAASFRSSDIIQRQLSIIDAMAFDALPFEFDINPHLREIKSSITVSTQSILNHM